MSDIVVYLQAIHQESNDNKCEGNQNSYPKSFKGKFFRKNISQNRKSNHQFKNIITELGEVVYLFLLQHGIIDRAMVVPGA